MNRRFLISTMRRGLWGCGLLLVIGAGTAVPAAQQESAVAPVMQLLQSGRVPPERLGTVLELVCQRGNSQDLAYVFAQVVEPGKLPAELRLQTLKCLVEAAQARNARPAGELAELQKLLAEQQPAIRRTAVQLAGLWQVASAAPHLRMIALDDQAPPALRDAAIAALAEIGGETAREALRELTRAKQPQAIRYLAVAALAEIDLQAAAQRAAEALASAADITDPGRMIAAFLDRQGGSQLLAQAISQQQVPADVAKLALRYMYSVGRNDEALSHALSTAAGIATGAESFSDQQLQALAEQVRTEGDPERGEAIFRREDLSCMKCHAIGQAGGDIGPDLSAVGSSSPVDYLLRSILLPSESIKEQYETVVVLTSAGKFYTGIVADRNDQRIVLKTADGQRLAIPIDDIDDELKGESLMPQGLAKFLTHQELVDLVRFLSELGKPGPYAIQEQPALQRWRLLQRPAEELIAAVPDAYSFQQKVLQADPQDYAAVYSRVSGILPVAPLTALADSDVLYLYGELDVTEPGVIGIHLNSAQGITAWIDEKLLEEGPDWTPELAEGRHRLTLRVDTRHSAPELTVHLVSPEMSAGVASFVTGR